MKFYFAIYKIIVKFEFVDTKKKKYYGLYELVLKYF